MTAEWTVDFFRPADAKGVAELFRLIYGEDYHVKSVYDPAQLIAEQETGATYRAVARTAAGEIIGHTAFCASSELNPSLYEAVQLLVHHDWRGTDLALELNNFAIPQLPLKYNLKAVWGEAVCNHRFSQRLYTDHHYAETGFELDLLPGEGMARSMKADRAGRVAAVVIFRPYEPRPQTIYLPPAYRQQLEVLYADYDHGHRFFPGEGRLAAGPATRSKISLYTQVGVARMNFTHVGGDFANRLAEYDSQSEENAIHTYQAFLPLTAPATGEAVDILRRRGYFLGGVVSRWFGDDGLLMQKIAGPPNFADIRLHTDRAKDILALVKADWQRAAGQTPSNS